MKRLPRFALVGAAGFAADALLLVLVVGALGLDPFSARLLSVSGALAFTWLLNRSFTFGPSARHPAVEGGRYAGVGVASSILNYLIYGLLLAALPGLPPLAALAVASLAVMIVSFFGYSRLVFGR
jgi:putative flippase GtrA